MKKEKVLIVRLLSAIMAMCFLGCSNDDEVTTLPEPKLDHLVSFSKSECKAVISSDKDYVRFVRDNGLECIEYKALSDGQLLLKHNGALFKGNSEDIKVSVAFNENNVEVKEQSTTESGGEMKAYNLEYVISPFSKGEFTLIVSNPMFGDGKQIAFPIDYTPDLTGFYEVTFMNDCIERYVCTPEGEYSAMLVGTSDDTRHIVAQIVQAPQEARDSVWPNVGDQLYLAHEDITDKVYSEGETVELQLNGCRPDNEIIGRWYVNKAEVFEEEKFIESVVPVEVSDNYTCEFFENALPAFGSGEKPLIAFDTEEGNSCLVLNDKESLGSIYEGTMELPPIDFSNYSLVLGIIRVPDSSFKLESQEIVVYENHNELILHLSNSSSSYPAFFDMYFWALYPKINGEVTTIIITE